jgi:hypothetical protein
MSRRESGRTFGVNNEGLLYAVPTYFDTDMEKNAMFSKPPMRIIMSRAVCDSLKAQLKPPVGRLRRPNVNDSVSVGDFIEYGSVKSVKNRPTGERYHDSRTYDVRKWK